MYFRFENLLAHFFLSSVVVMVFLISDKGAILPAVSPGQNLMTLIWPFVGGGEDQGEVV